MIVTKGLIHKILALYAVCGVVGGALIYHHSQKRTYINPHPSIDKVGLDCGEAREWGSDCSINSRSKILIKGEGEEILEVSSLGNGSLRLYKVEEEDTYREGFKFRIEDKDIATNKEDIVLREFETYEIEEKNGNYFLSRKSEAEEEIKRDLGLPEEDCDLPTDDTPQECNIFTTEKLNNIKFFYKWWNVSLSGGITTFTISRDDSEDSYPFGYRFTFRNSNETDATLTYGNKRITIKKDTDVDFRIRRERKRLSLDNWTLEDLAKKVGLQEEGQRGDYLRIGDSLNIKQGSKKGRGRGKEETIQSGKIKVLKDQAGYYQGFKFYIEEGDIELYQENKSTTISLLSQYETYEIRKDEDGTWYLTRKEGNQEKIKELINLPCELPGEDQDSVECKGDIKTIKFSGSETITTEGNPKLIIHSENLRKHYPAGYRFVFTSGSNTGDSSITIGKKKIDIKKGVDVDFRIDLKYSGEMSLEKAWTPETLMNEVGFRKENDWWVLGDGTMNIKQGDNKSTSLRMAWDQFGKIKVDKKVPGYNQGYKFTIEDGNLNFDPENSIGQLSRYETYEIVKDKTDEKYYFTRKTSALEVVKEKLGFPKECIKSSESSCQLDSTKLKGIKFSGKGESEEVTIGEGGSVFIKLDGGNSGDFPMGYRFTLISNGDITIPQTSSPSISIKANTNTEFKIKEESGGNLTLEKAWTVDSLGKKLRLSRCGESSQEKCSFGNKISVWESEGSYVNDATVADYTGKKISYELDQKGYNQGIKFFVEEDIKLKTTAAKGDQIKPSSIDKRTNGSPTYEIAQKTVTESIDKWYLVKK